MTVLREGMRMFTGKAMGLSCSGGEFIKYPSNFLCIIYLLMYRYPIRKLWQFWTIFNSRISNPSPHRWQWLCQYCQSCMSTYCVSCSCWSFWSSPSSSWIGRMVAHSAHWKTIKADSKANKATNRKTRSRPRGIIHTKIIISSIYGDAFKFNKEIRLFFKRGFFFTVNCGFS